MSGCWQGSVGEDEKRQDGQLELRSLGAGSYKVERGETSSDVLAGLIALEVVREASDRPGREWDVRRWEAGLYNKVAAAWGSVAGGGTEVGVIPMGTANPNGENVEAGSEYRTRPAWGDCSEERARGCRGGGRGYQVLPQEQWAISRPARWTPFEGTSIREKPHALRISPCIIISRARSMELLSHMHRSPVGG